MPTLLDPVEVTALMAPGVDEPYLTKAIEREEDWLANDPVSGIGPLVGSRTVTIWVRPGEDRPLLLTRRTASVAVKDNGTSLASDQFALLGGLRIERLVGAAGGPIPVPYGWIGPKVDVTFTPIDQKAIERVLIELVRLTLSASPFNQESADGHSYSRPEDIDATRSRLARSLRPYRGPMSTQLGSGLVSGRVIR